MDMEISTSSAKIRVLVDGLQPLSKETVLEFPDGSETLVYLDYKNLKNHCQHCQRLTHELKNCPGAPRPSDIANNPAPKPFPAAKVVSRNYYTPGDNFVAPRSCSQGFERSLTSHREGESRKRPYAQVGGGSHPQEDGRPSFSHDQADGRGSRSPDYHRRSHTRGESKPPHLRRSHVSSQPNRAFQWREKSPSSLGHHQETSESSRTRRPPMERNMSTYDPPTPPPPPLTSSCRRNLNPSDIISPVTVIPSKDQVLNELREVTIQYTSCTDPT